MATANSRVPSPQRRLASITEAAEYLGLSTKTIRRYIAYGRITGYRITGHSPAQGRLIRVDLNEVDAVLLQPIPTAAG